VSVVLPPELELFVNERVANGAYPTQRDVLRAAYDLLERRERLLAHIDEGTRDLAAGRFVEYGPVDQDRFLADIEAAAAQNPIAEDAV
jgi:putative addiction module CopG family antidote